MLRSAMSGGGAFSSEWSSSRTGTPRNRPHELGARVGRRCIELGANLNIGRQGSAHIFRIAPPLTVTRDQIDTALAILDQALTECVKE